MAEERAAGAGEVPAPPAGGEPSAAAAETGAVGRRRSVALQGTMVSPGMTLGVVHRKDYDLSRASAERVPLDQVDRELNRLRRGLDASRAQLHDLRARLRGRVHEDDARILDTHIAYLKDSVFIADVENLILNEQMRLEAAIAKVVADFDRIFRLVQNEALRQSAVDLRDVGIRVLRNLEQDADEERVEAPSDYVLVAKELSIVDMFNLSNEHVKGIATREGGVTSHAAIFARSMGIPTITGVEGLLDEVDEGDFVILDATEGVLRVRPDEIVRQQYAESLEEDRGTPQTAEAPEWARGETSFAGEDVVVLASAGNLPEVDQAARLGLQAVGLYRTELLYLVDPAPPSRDALVRHYASVLQGIGGNVVFRLLNADSSLGIAHLHGERENNPALGRVGIRVLLADERVMRRQLQAILVAGHGQAPRIAVPFVTDCGELQRVREILLEERLGLRKAGEPFQDSVEVGAVVETPASMLGIRDLAREADFLLLNLDALQQYLLAADRENAGLAPLLEALHPYVLRAVGKACDVARAEGNPVSVFGVTASHPDNVPLLLGIGLRSFCVAPGELRAILDVLRAVDAQEAVDAARVWAASACLADTRSHVAGYRHGYARP